MHVFGYDEVEKANQFIAETENIAANGIVNLPDRIVIRVVENFSEEENDKQDTILSLSRTLNDLKGQIYGGMFEKQQTEKELESATDQSRKDFLQSQIKDSELKIESFTSQLNYTRELINKIKAGELSL
jgi:predicted RND superfamily exporter protein